MARNTNHYHRTHQGVQQRTQAVEIDEGLRAYMLKVYNYMALGLTITGLVAYTVSLSEPMIQLIFGTPLKWVVMFAPLVYVFMFSSRVHTMQASTAQVLFWGFAALMGVSLATIFLAYTPISITRVFFITAGTFAGMSLYGYTTHRDLTQFGSFLIMGLIGIILASLANFFIASSGLHFVVSILGVLIFTGLTAYDTQKIKLLYNEMDHPEVATKKAIVGALDLYLDFVNLFLLLLRFFGDRR